MNGITITLPDGVAASCVAYDGENYYACDGVRTVVYEFDASGQPAGCYNTVRPYKALRSDAYSGGFLALGGGCGRNIYYLDANMRETGRYVLPEREARVTSGLRRTERCLM